MYFQLFFWYVCWSCCTLWDGCISRIWILLTLKKKTSTESITKRFVCSLFIWRWNCNEIQSLPDPHCISCILSVVCHGTVVFTLSPPKNELKLKCNFPVMLFFIKLMRIFNLWNLYDSNHCSTAASKSILLLTTRDDRQSKDAKSLCHWRFRCLFRFLFVTAKVFAEFHHVLLWRLGH